MLPQLLLLRLHTLLLLLLLLLQCCQATTHTWKRCSSVREDCSFQYPSNWLSPHLQGSQAGAGVQGVIR